MSDDARIAKLEAKVAELEKIIAGLRAVFTGGSTDDAASDRELDAQWGDPEVKLIPRDWTAGGVVKGQKFSRCPADFLELYAESMDYFAQKNDASNAKDAKGRPKSFYDRKNARYARGWARRLRSGWEPPAKPAPSFGGPTTFGGGAAPFAGADSSDPFAMPPRIDWRRRAPDPAGLASSAAEDGMEDIGTDFPFGANAAPAARVELDDDEDDDLPINAGREAAE